MTIEERVDERTGMSTKVIIESKDPDKRPRVSVKDDGGQDARSCRAAPRAARYPLPVGIYLNVADGSACSPATSSPRCPRETTKTKDITGGLPRVAELFEARKPKEFAVISEIDGIVTFGKDTKGKRKLEYVDRRRVRVELAQST